MAARHWSKFFWADWESDEALRQCSLAAQGLWMRMLCICAKGDPYGYVSIAGEALDANGLSTAVGRPADELAPLLAELGRWGVFSRDRRGRIYSRRLLRDAQKAQDGRKHIAKRWAQAADNKDEKSRPNRVPNRGPTTQKLDTRKDEGSVSSLRSETAAGPLDLKRALWEQGKRMLMRAGKSKDEAGKLLGKWCKTHSHGEVLDALARTEAAAPGGDIVGYIEQILKPSRAPPSSDAPDENLVWRAILGVWRKHGCQPSDWPEGRGLPPGRPGCQVPRKLLEEFDLLEKSA